MRRPRSLLLAATAGLALLASACGVIADTTAASVAGTDVPVDDVTALVQDPAFNQQGSTEDESTQSGEVARAALIFLIERQAWIAELERWGLSIDDEVRGQVSSELDTQIARSGLEVSDRYRSLLIDYQAAQTVLGERFAGLDPDSDEDLRRLYDGAELQWQQVCLTVVQLPAEQVGRAQDALDGDTTVDELPERIDGAQVVADPSQGCFAEAGLVPELRADLSRAAVGVSRGVVLAEDANGVAAYAYRLEARRNLSFDDARADLAAAAQSLVQQGPAQWVQLLTLGATVDPRYGSDVISTASGFEISPPPRPVLPLADRLEQAVAAARAAASAATSAPTEASGG